MIFVEMMSHKGHVSLNNFYLQHLMRDGDTLIIGHSLAYQYQKFNLIEFEDGINKRLWRFRNAVKIFRKLLRSKDCSVCFLSYDQVWLPLLSIILKLFKKKIYCFEHGTCPVIMIKKMFQIVLGRKVVHITYTSYIADVYKKIGLTAYSVDHPIISKNTISRQDLFDDLRFAGFNERRKKVVFCPSGSVGFGLLEDYVESMKDVLFVCKGEQDLYKPNVVIKKYFPDYYEIMKMSDAILIPFCRSDKVSGPLFEAIGLNKTVIVKKNKFGLYAKKKFPRHVRFDTESWFETHNTIAPATNFFEVKKYNDAVIDQLMLIMRNQRPEPARK